MGGLRCVGRGWRGRSTRSAIKSNVSCVISEFDLSTVRYARDAASTLGLVHGGIADAKASCCFTRGGCQFSHGGEHSTIAKLEFSRCFVRCSLAKAVIMARYQWKQNTAFLLAYTLTDSSGLGCGALRMNGLPPSEVTASAA
jgi:hypothetical protein